MFADLNREEAALWDFLQRPPDAYSLKVKAVRLFAEPLHVGCEADGRAVGLGRSWMNVLSHARFCFQCALPLRFLQQGGVDLCGALMGHAGQPKTRAAYKACETPLCLGSNALKTRLIEQVGGYFLPEELLQPWSRRRATPVRGRPALLLACACPIRVVGLRLGSRARSDRAYLPRLQLHVQPQHPEPPKPTRLVA